MYLRVDSSGEERSIKKTFNFEYQNAKMQASCNVWLIVGQIYGLHTQHLVYSSVERGGEDYDDQLTLDRLAKVQIERHIKLIEDLRWTCVFCGIDFLQKKSN